MILQALTQLYEDLIDRGEIARPGWGPAKISYALGLDEDGQLIQVIPLLVEVQSGKKTVMRPQEIRLPAAVKRTVGILPNFLWDNSSYILGVDEKGKPKRSLECFQACRQMHHQILDGVDSSVARAICSYFDSWNPELARQHPALSLYWDELMKGANLVFRVNGQFAQEDAAIAAAWEAHYHKTRGVKTQ